MQLPLVRGRSVHASCPARRLPSRAGFLPAAAIGLASLSAAQTVDGTIVGDGYPRLAVQACNTTFGDNVNELNGGYGKIVGGKLYLAFPGNIGGANIDKLDIFLDVKSGGENTLSGTLTMDGANAMSGLQFDSGFEADFLVICRQNTSNSQFDVDLGDVVTGNSDAFADVFSGATEGSATASIGSPSILSNGIEIAYDDSNTAGVDGTGPSAATRANAAAVQTGVELGITLSDLGYTTGDDIRVCAFINNVTHTFISNQVLGSLPSNYGNMATPSSVNFGNEAGDQFFTVPASSTGFDSSGAVAATFAEAELVETGDLDGDGDDDAVAYSASTGEIVYFENTWDSNGGWAAAVTIATLSGASQMQVVDVTGDGDLDVAAISSSQQRLEYYENQLVEGGSLSFGSANVLATSAAPASLVAAEGFVAADFDQDGDTLDFVIGDNAQTLYIADADGSVVTEISGYPGVGLGVKKVAAGDFDGVNGPDVVLSATYSNGSLLAIMNTGSPTFGNAFRVKGDLTGIDRLEVAQFDGVNGDDVISSATNGSSGRVDLIKSNVSGLNTFPTTSLTGLSGTIDAAFADVNGDGLLDVVVSEAGTGNVYSCSNNGSFFDVAVTIGSSIEVRAGLASGDLDGDGDEDLLVGDESTIRILQNEASLGFSVACVRPGGAISAAGSSLVDTNSLTIQLSGAQSGQMGYFINSWLNGASPGSPITPPAGVNGQICIGGTSVVYGRHSRPEELFTTDGSGAASLTIDANNLHNPRNGISWPNPGNNVTTVLTGETWYWQAWYRITGGSEFSDAIGITFR